MRDRELPLRGGARRIDEVDPLSIARSPSAAFLAPQLREWIVGFGTVERIAGRSAAEATDAVAAQTVQWSGEAPDVPGPWLGGVAFDPARCADEWEGFGAARFELPAVALAHRAGRTFALAFGRTEDAGALAAELDAWMAELTRHRGASGEVRRTALHQDRSAWDAMVETALERIYAGALEKVVPARAVTVELAEAPEPAALLRALGVSHPTAARFLFTDGRGRTFLGATPETLLRVEQGRLRTEALAGTVPLGTRVLGDKERREHHAVVEGIAAALARVAEAVEVGNEPELVPLRHFAHLRTRIAARLRADARLGEAVAALHPTPAVCGTPTAEARDFLAAQEGFERGWYAGAVGWLGEGAAHFSVGIRSALLEGATARVYAGAGVVAGSTAEGEWRETAAKTQTLLEVLGGAHAGD